ncbi:aspartyl protease family protein [Sphingomonas carotinifaciens]|uniref:aspartyl protease family protein n=1 Tax=Sphingomonas carotinifaciens TaxID=1166323 RepID=UPI0039A2C98F
MRRLLVLAPLLIAPLVVATTHAGQQASPPSVVAEATRDPGTGRLADDTENRWVPFTLTPGNQIRFTMTLDGRPMSAILDTGVSFTVLARTSKAVVQKRLRSGGSATAIGGAVAVGWMPTRRVELGGLTRTGGGVTVADLPAIATGDAEPVDLLVGRDLTALYALDIDYAGKRFRLLPSGRMPFAGAVAPLTISTQRRVYESAMRLGAGRLAPVIVDTGDGSSVTVTRAGWTAARLDRLPVTSTIGFGLGGASVNELAIVPHLTLGTLDSQNVEVRIEPPGGFSQSIGVAGRIGSGFLGRYRVLLDPYAGRMVLKGDGTQATPLRSTSGLLVGVAPDRLRVLHVMRGSPAEAAGWRTDDLICAIDGQPVARDYATSPLARWSVAAPGTVVRLSDCEGHTRALTLRRFY